MLRAGTSRMRTRGSVGCGTVSRVYLRGTTNATRYTPPARACSTGAVIAIFSPRFACSTGAVIAISARAVLSPLM